MDIIVLSQSDEIEERKNSDTDNTETDPEIYYGSRKWEWGFLRKECENLGLEDFYKTYIQRVQRSFLSIFLVLQTFITLVHVIVIITNRKDPELPENPDVLSYTISILIVWICLFPTFKEDLVKQHPWIPYVCSCAAIFTLIIIDLFIPLYHALFTFTNPPLRPAHASHILFMIYIFLPLSENWHAFILGVATMICYLIVMTLVSFRLVEELYIKVFTELIFLMCLNFTGIYFRLLNEVTTRRTFLDRRECVEGNLLLKYERNQEKELLLSILPEHTAGVLEKDIRKMIKQIRTDRNKKSNDRNSRDLDTPWSNQKIQWRGQAINKLYIEQHSDVSILYADVVNYTQITTQLPVRTLVETLHELFVKFDEASQEFNVLRIKFLGDCYYCVSGVPVKNKRHAKNCVDLGLRMIKDIRDVRTSRDLDIDMRIGVHSGTIISGVIGACKWQYDIWSKDVNIANRMESTGKPGKVHVTGQTLVLLEEQYLYDEGTEKAKLDPVLKANNIQTYLIAPQYFAENNYYQTPEETSFNYSVRVSTGVRRKTQLNRKASKLTENTTCRRNFMQNSMEQFREIMKQTNVEMAHELERMPIGKFQWNKVYSTSKNKMSKNKSDDDYDSDTDDKEIHVEKFNKISTFFLCFRYKKWELLFLKEPDMMLMYSVLMGFIVFLAIIGIQILNDPLGWRFWVTVSVSCTILFIYLPITWFKKIWDFYMPAEADDANMIIPPTNKFCKILYNFSYKIKGNAYARTAMYLIAVGILILCSLIHLVECSGGSDEHILNSNPAAHNISSVLTTFSPCSNPWAVTNCVVLTICLSFLFLKINFILKFIVGCVVFIFYGWIIFESKDHVYENSASYNSSLDAKIAHCMNIAFTLIVFHMIDRQTEYVARVDYNWKQQLMRKHEEAEVTKETNKILVQNILPSHVAEIYMNHQLKNEFYNEEYEDVAIMFATITNLDINYDDSVENEKNMLNVLNEIICDFDEQLLINDESLKIEKIKVAGWTYMAACGLDVGRSESVSSMGIRNMSSLNRASLMTNGRRSLNQPKILTLDRKHLLKKNSRKSQNVVIVLAGFALKLMKALHRFNIENFLETNPGQLRIGISHGKVMAGVVGSSKPLYDVWGNAVNMASRMDSTGIPGKIQVTSETAKVLQSFGHECDYRGEIQVKGRGKIPTFFIRTDDNLEFIRSQTSDNCEDFITKL